MKDGNNRCTHCGSANVEEARRSVDEITFRCLHCWKTFTSRLAVLTNQDDDAA